MGLVGQRVHQLLIPHHGHHRRARRGQRQRLVVVPGALPQPNPGTVHRQRRHQHQTRDPQRDGLGKADAGWHRATGGAQLATPPRLGPSAGRIELVAKQGHAMRLGSLSMALPFTTAIVPAAGLGTRFLPTTKAVPKELFPVVDTPGIELVAAEAAEAGATRLIIVSSPGKDAVVEYFRAQPELEETLRNRGKTELVA